MILGCDCRDMIVDHDVEYWWFWWLKCIQILERDPPIFKTCIATVIAFIALATDTTIAATAAISGIMISALLLLLITLAVVGICWFISVPFPVSASASASLCLILSLSTPHSISISASIFTLASLSLFS